MGKKQELEAEIVRLTRFIVVQKNIADINDETIGFLCNMHNEDNGRVDNARRWSAAWKRAAKWERTGHLLALERIKEAKHWCPRLLRERDDVRAVVEAQNATILHLNNEIQTLASHIGRLEAERDEARAKIDGMRKEIDLVLADWDEATAKIKTLQSQVQFSEKQNQNLITHHRIERDRAAFETEALKSQVAHLETERDEAVANNKRLLDDLLHNSHSFALELDYDYLKKENATLQSQVNHLESDRDALAKKVDEYRTVLEWVEGQKRSELSIYYRDIIREVQKALRKA